MKTHARSQLTVITCFVAASLIFTGAARGETVKAGDIEVTVRKDGCGIVDEVKFKGKVVMSTVETGNTPTPGFEIDDKRTAAAKQLTAALKALKVDAPCKLSESTSPRGHKLITLQNGLLKVTVLPMFGGRIIRLESKVSGANFLHDPYEDHPDEIKEPKDIGGLWGELADKIFQPKIVKRTDDEIVLVLTSDDGKAEKIEKTLTLRRGSTTLVVAQKQTNTGDVGREAENHLYGRFRVGAPSGLDDALWGSSRGRATRFRRRGSSPNCHADPRLDHWAALCDVKEGTALLSVYDGPVTRVGTWVKEEFYQLEWWTPRHFTLPARGGMTTKLLLAPCFNMGGVAFVNADLAVGITAESDVVVAARAPAWRTRLTAVSLGKPDRKITLKAHLTDRHGKTVKTLPPVEVACPFLIAQPRLVSWPMDGVSSGAYRMHVSIVADGKEVGKTVLAVQRAGAGPILELFRPADEEKDKTFPVLGAVERGKVEVTSVRKTDDRTIRVAGKHVFKGSSSPYTAEIKLNAQGDGFDIRHAVTCNGGKDGERVRAVGVALPMMLGNDDYRIRTTVGGEDLNDTWRIDQSDEGIYTSTVSDYHSRWPLWRLGGVLQDTPTHYRIWKASAWDTAPTVTLEGNKAPGWIEANNRRWGVRIEMPGMSAKAPRGILVDGRGGYALVHFYPPQAPPVSLQGSGDAAAPSRAERLGLKRGRPWTNTVQVRFQAGPHTRGFKREISDKAFRAVLEALGDPTVPRSLTTLGIARGSLEECIQNILDSEVSFRTYMRRGVRGGSPLRKLCNQFRSNYSRDFNETLGNLIKALNEKYK